MVPSSPNGRQDGKHIHAETREGDAALSPSVRRAGDWTATCRSRDAGAAAASAARVPRRAVTARRPRPPTTRTAGGRRGSAPSFSRRTPTGSCLLAIGLASAAYRRRERDFVFARRPPHACGPRSRLAEALGFSGDHAGRNATHYRLTVVSAAFSWVTRAAVAPPRPHDAGARRGGDTGIHARRHASRGEGRRSIRWRRDASIIPRTRITCVRPGDDLIARRRLRSWAGRVPSSPIPAAFRYSVWPIPRRARRGVNPVAPRRPGWSLSPGSAADIRRGWARTLPWCSMNAPGNCTRDDAGRHAPHAAMGRPGAVRALVGGRCPTSRATRSGKFGIVQGGTQGPARQSII
jgi:hypothetical protein